jgi:hypothetical protein
MGIAASTTGSRPADGTGTAVVATTEQVRRRDRRRPRPRTIGAVVATFLLVLAVFLISPIAAISDPHPIPYTARSLLYDRDLDLKEYGADPANDYALVRVDGQVISYFPWMTAVFAVPFVAGQDALSTTGLVPSVGDQIAAGDLDLFQRVSAGAITAAAVVLLALVTRRLLRLAGDPTDGTGRTDRWWFLPLTGTILALATPAWSTASRGLWQHGPGLLLLGGAWLAALYVSDGPATGRDRTLALLSGALCGVAFWTRPTNAVFAVALFAFVAIRRRDVSLRWLIGSAATLVLGLLADIVLIGRALPPYFSAGRVSLHGDVPLAVATNLVSPSRGLLTFSPFVVLGLLTLAPRRRRLLGTDLTVFATAAVAASAAAVLVVSSFAENWWGGHSYGPRFLSESFVVLGPLALVTVFGPRPPGVWPRAVSTVVAPILIALSILAHAGGALTQATECWSRSPEDVDRHPERLSDWSDPEVLAGLRIVSGSRNASGCPNGPAS